MNEEYVQRKKQANDLEMRISGAHLSYYEVYTLYRTTWLAQIRFYSCHSSFSKQQFNEIQELLTCETIRNLDIIGICQGRLCMEVSTLVELG